MSKFKNSNSNFKLHSTVKDLIIANTTFQSRLLLGSGKFFFQKIMAEAIEHPARNW